MRPPAKARQIACKELIERTLVAAPRASQQVL
jgi:hypothetical protein